MIQNDLTPSDFDRLHEAAQKVFDGLAKKIQPRFPTLNAIFGHTTTKKFPMYSYVTFEDQARPEIDPVVVGVDVRVDTGEIVIQAHAMGEETGAAYFDVPKRVLPFQAAHTVVLEQTTHAAQQLADNAMPVLEQVFGCARPVLPNQDATLPEAAHKAGV